MTDAPQLPAVIGVAGAGTMGAGIAQLACTMGARTLLYDPVPGAAERGAQRALEGLEKLKARGRLTVDEVRAAWERLDAVDALDGLAASELVIEAAPEDMELKRELFGRLSHGIVAADCVIASNTSSIPITALAALAQGPERVVGMHFFNPAPVMRLVEVIAGVQTGERALAIARATGAAMGKRVIDAADGPGFLVNRCGRPFGLEALRAVQEGLAGVQAVDRIVRLGGGFRMGPFELQDLVGIDTGFEVSKSFFELSFGEPRWRPSTLSARMVASGRHGRKTGRGWYAYDGGDGIAREPDPEAPAASGPVGLGNGLVLIDGELPVADELRALALEAGWDVRDPGDADGEIPFLLLDCAGAPGEEPLQGGPIALLCAEGSLAALDGGGPAAGFHALPPLRAGGLVELTRSSGTSDLSAARTEAFFGSLGLHTAWVGDAPGLVLGRLVCQLVNEAAFAVGEGVGGPDDVDDGMVLGLNHPRGPLAWGDVIGLDHVLAVLDALREERGDPAYRAAPLLRRMVWEGRLGVATGAGFHDHGE
ncbi:MAG TPA: 3-hydroxyacyl-CoA dehydrogenase NAD-binding domain-containing protein [Solirubrobacteraceae bacterium]|nr:3-hydroxyacyl-CoA dehydrogenase NAD-binding domain-containing protein [Solirubrobacteraceae bacterium]